MKLEALKDSKKRIKSKIIHSEKNWEKCIISKTHGNHTYVRTNPSLQSNPAPYLTANSPSWIALFHDHKKFAFLAPQLDNIHNEINKSRYILSLENNWDDDGSLKYEADVWKKAVGFLAKYSTKVYKSFKQIILTPKINHGPNGSIDIYWLNENFSLLVNVPVVGDITFYGEDQGNKVEGIIDYNLEITNTLPFLIKFI